MTRDARSSRDQAAVLLAIVLANSIGFKGIDTDDLALKALDLLSK